MSLLYNKTDPPKKLSWAEQQNLDAKLKFEEDSRIANEINSARQGSVDAYDVANKTYRSEQERVNAARAKLVSLAKAKTLREDPSTRTRLSWIGDGVSHGSNGRYFCNSHTCELAEDAGITVDTIPEGTILPLGTRRTYTGGEKWPLIPGNPQMDGFATSAGFKYVDKPQPGDLVREELWKTKDYQNNEFKHPKWITSHSLIYGKDDQGNAVHYNSPGGHRELYEASPASDLEDHQDPREVENGMRLRYLRYYGNLDKFEADRKAAEAEMNKTEGARLPHYPVQYIDTNIVRETDPSKYIYTDLATQKQNDKYAKKNKIGRYFKSY
jgi:hypothetical protein